MCNRTSTIYNRLIRRKNEYITGRSERDGNRPERMMYTITDKPELLKKEILKHLTGFNDDPRTLGCFLILLRRKRFAP